VGTPTTTTPTTPTSTFLSGVCGNFDNNPTQSAPVATTGTEWDAMKTAGAKMVRVDASWGEIESATPTSSPTSPYNWTRLDNLMSLATGNSRGMNLLIILDYSHPVFSAHGYEPPIAGTAKTHWDGFVQAIVARYPHAWFEVWNEPDIYGQDASLNWKGFWYPLNEPPSGTNPNPPTRQDPAYPNDPTKTLPVGPKPSEYVDLLVDTAAQIRTVGAFDGKILMGGIAYPSPRNYPPYPYQPVPVNGWIDAVLNDSRNPASLVDALNIHTYTNRGESALVAEQARTFKAVLAAHSLSTKPWYVTETGMIDAYPATNVLGGWLVPYYSNPAYTSGSTNLVPASGEVGGTGWTTNGDQRIQGAANAAAVPTYASTGSDGKPSDFASDPTVLAKRIVPNPAYASIPQGVVSRNSAITTSTYYTVSVYLRSTTPRVLYIASQATLPSEAVAVEVDGTWRRYTVTVKTVAGASARCFEVFGVDNTNAWDIAAPMAVLCDDQGTEGSTLRGTFLATLAAKSVEQKPAAMKRMMQALQTEGAAGAFVFAWRDYGVADKDKWGLANANGSLKAFPAGALTNCLVP